MKEAAVIKTIQIGNSSYEIASDDNYLDTIGACFEPHMVRLFSTLVTQNDVVADIGANIGLTSILFASLVRKVFAFEPSPSTFRLLLGNLGRAHVSNVEASNLGFGRRNESLTLTFIENNRSGAFVSNHVRPVAEHVTENIQLDTLDNFFGNSSIVPNFLKIDAEGFEQHVIQGGKRYIEKNRPTVVMEMNHFCLDVLQRITIPDFLDYMRLVFPHLYAVDTDNSLIEDLHNPEKAYHVMHAHVVQHRFPNIVGGFDHTLGIRLQHLAANSDRLLQYRQFQTPAVTNTSGSIQVIGAIPEPIHAGCVLSIQVIVSNTSKEAWYGYGDRPVRLSYHWLDVEGNYLVFDGTRTAFTNKMVLPGASVQECINIDVPEIIGNFQLVLTLVQEGVCWFEPTGFNAHAGLYIIK